MVSNKIPAVLIESAWCVGSGKNLYKRINGLTKKVLERAHKIAADYGVPITILVPSHTCWLNQRYKLAVYRDKTWGWTHRQGCDADYVVLAAV